LEGTAANVPGQRVADRYVLSRVLGRGSSGVIFAAMDDEGAEYAIKVVPESLVGKEGADRFLREARLVSNRDSPHVMRVLDWGRDAAQGVLFLAMPVVSRRSLADLLMQTGPLEPAIAVRIALQVCKGLSVAHSNGVVHRDIKPSNLLLSETAAGVTVVVCDFGAAKRLELYDDSNLTFTGRFLGSPAYMSPEQAKSAKRVDERTDIWSLGITLFEMLTGASPFKSETTLSDLVVAICTRDVPAIQAVAPWIEPGLAGALQRALRRERGERWPTAARLAEALRPFAGDSEVILADELTGVRPSTRARVLIRADIAADIEAVAPEGDASSPEEALVGRRLNDRYLVTRFIKRGGMGIVYEAEAPDGGAAAVKVIARDLAGSSRETTQRFLREARTAAAIDHPNVIRVLETGYDDELRAPFIVMELLDGIDCATLFRRSAPIEPLPLARLFAQAAAGISAAHASGVVHRDVKPANLYLHVERTTSEITAKMCDFGIAKAAAGAEASSWDLTGTGRIVGSPIYMSPEQARNARNVDERADVWSLCISLHEGLTGRRAWHGLSALGEIILAICTEDAPRVRELAPWVPKELADIVERGLAREPSDRWQSMSDLAAALQEFAGGSLVVLREDLKRVDDDRLRLLPVEGLAAKAVGSTTLGTVLPVSEAHRKRNWIVAAAVVAIAASGISIAYRARDAASPATENVAAAPAVANVVASVAVEPLGTRVSVDGVRVEVHEGRFTLRGQPGQAFDVVLQSDTRMVRHRVVVAVDGTASPASLAIADPNAVASASTSWSKPKPASRVSRSKPAPSATEAPPSPPRDVLKPPSTWGNP
jgi:serine/threonine protein kinase